MSRTHVFVKFSLIVIFGLWLGAMASCLSPSPAGQSENESDSQTLVFLLIGQSNMEGKPKPQAVDLKTNSRIQVLSYQNNAAQGRMYNKWYTAVPPLHSSWAGVGPGDYFAKTLIDVLPENYSIGLVPCGISGVDIDFFRKGVISARRTEFSIPPDNSSDGSYEWVLQRARLAQEKGKIAGVLLHQGESDAGQSIWLDKVKEIIADLRTDLGIPDLPLLVGELYYDGPCAGHNRVIAKIPAKIDNAYVISASGLKGVDQFHFDLESMRELGRRYAEVMIPLLELN